jgi:hypothetical protein
MTKNSSITTLPQPTGNLCKWENNRFWTKYRRRKNGPNQESDISKETAGSNKQCTAFGVNDSMTNISSKERESDSKRN